MLRIKESMLFRTRKKKIFKRQTRGQTGNTLVIPGISLSKLQLQSMVDFILSVSISDM